MKFSDMDEKVIADSEATGITLECDLLHAADIGNSNCCTIIDGPEQINTTGSNFLLIHFDIHSIPAHKDEFYVLLESLAKPNVTILGSYETWLSGMN